jgi:hypothetical protein
MDQPELTKDRIKYAFFIAVAADAFDFLFAWIETSDSPFLVLLGKFLGVFLDCAVMAAMTKLLGFHWVFLPGFCVEAVPSLDMFPTWVGCVMFVVWQQKKAEGQQPQSPRLRPLIDVDQIKSVGSSLVAKFTSAPPITPGARAAIPVDATPVVQPPFEERLKKLAELRDKNLISQSEYDAKRQQILADI